MPQRSVTGEDSSALLELFHRAELAELGEPYTTLADVDRLLGTPGLDLTTRSIAILDASGRLDGFAALYPAPNQRALRAQLVVEPERPTEVANVLLDLLADWANTDNSDDVGEVNLYQLPNTPAEAALTAHGWRIVHSSTRLVIDLAAPRVPSTPNPRVRVRSATTEEEQRLAHAILEDAIAQDWNHQRKEFADFLAAQQARPGYDARLWFVAELDDKPAGVLIARDPDGRPWVAWLGVAETARGNGLAKNLLLTAFDVFRARGRSTVGVDTDTHNATDAVKVYEKAGMVSQGTADAWSRDLSP
ncbi:MAG TPA: GNAT family N-acetyltransferase [Pseudonocardiaceae bacterium]|jgi:GNAT superfamily N-acetyltransferase|nr:GNAT family N-acetyltransferase [Pseudonocardiaceae bacterium]